MNVKISETKENTFKDTSIKGLLINVYMKAAVVNTAIVAADFLPQSVIVKAQLFRDKEETTIVQNNLKILGLYSCLNYGQHNWDRGNIIALPAAGVFSTKLISLFLDFGGVINVKGDDELYIEVTLGGDAFSAAMNQGVSYVEFNPEFGVGYEKYTPQIKSKVVQATENSQKFSIGDNCIKLAFLNFDHDTLVTPAIVTASIQSTQYSASLNLFDLLNRHWNVFTSPTINYRYGNTQPVVPASEALPFLPKYPESVIMFASGKHDVQELDNCQIDLSLNSANVTAGNNYIVSTVGYCSRALLERASARETKHMMEKVATLAPH